MKLVVFSAAPIITMNGEFFAYSPYVKEMIIWDKYAKEIYFCCPKWNDENKLLVLEIPFKVRKVFWVPDFNIKQIGGVLKAIIYVFYSILIIFRAMKQADHIHLRCPGNIGLLGCIVQILFPNKPKTAKYAGNWDPKSKQPLSYRLQKWILNHPVLTKNMKVLVYGEWPNSSQNIKPFFTATYSESDKIKLLPRKLTESIRFLFVGTLSSGKQPLYALQLVKELKEKGYNVHLDFYGEGKERERLDEYLLKHKLNEVVNLKGNASQEAVKQAYQKSHFLLLPSKSEGWPKVVAEAMFWGCVPVATPVSCVPYILDYGNRGVILSSDLSLDVQVFEDLINDQSAYDSKSQSALDWSQQYTLDYFEEEIQKLLEGSAK